jgi:hypothetical protein
MKRIVALDKFPYWPSLKEKTLKTPWRRAERLALACRRKPGRSREQHVVESFATVSHRLDRHPVHALEPFLADEFRDAMWPQRQADLLLFRVERSDGQSLLRFCRGGV